MEDAWTLVHHLQKGKLYLAIHMKYLPEAQTYELTSIYLLTYSMEQSPS